jgi:hypothetical protein
VPEGVELPRVERSMEVGGVRIDTLYEYPPYPRGATAGYTAPAIRWQQTTVRGLTSEPLVLSGYFSQTYAPYHHNFGGQYLFDPRLEPLSDVARAELLAADVAYLVVLDSDGPPPELWLGGFDGSLRALGAATAPPAAQ